MKKLVIAFAMVLALGSVANAQTATAAKTTAAKTVVVKPATAVVAKPSLSTATVKPVAAPKAATATKVKADGTPDMRFKANKTAKAATVAGPKKADGTADMRYKANKVAAAKKP